MGAESVYAVGSFIYETPEWPLGLLYAIFSPVPLVIGLLAVYVGSKFKKIGGAKLASLQSDPHGINPEHGGGVA